MREHIHGEKDKLLFVMLVVRKLLSLPHVCQKMGSRTLVRIMVLLHIKLLLFPHAKL